MNGKTNKSMRNLICAAIVTLGLAGCAKEARATIVTTTYEFMQEESTVTVYGYMSGHQIYFIEGQFQLTVDFDGGIASFDQVDATYGDGWSLGERFHMTELDGTIVGDTEIEFEGQIPPPLSADVFLELTFMDNSVYLTGYCNETWAADLPSFNLDAVAVPEPAMLSLVGLGWLILRKRN